MRRDGQTEMSARTGLTPEDRDRYLARAREVLAAEVVGLETSARSLDEGFARAVRLLLTCPGRVIVTGVGKSGHVARKLAATLTSTGTRSFFIHPVDAVHGDLGILDGSDVVLIVSNSGESEELIRMVPLFHRFRVPIVLLTSFPGSTLARSADLVVNVGQAPEASPESLVPTTSSTSAQAVGDALAMVLMEERGFRRQDFAFLHPGGVIGKKIMRTVGDLMHAGPELPMVHQRKTMKEALVTIVRGRLGVTTVVDDAGVLVGIITDGDLKRILLRSPSRNILETAVGEVMTRDPKVIDRGAPVVAALERMENNLGGSITSLVVVDAENRPQGIIHIHDCLKP